MDKITLEFIEKEQRDIILSIRDRINNIQLTMYQKMGISSTSPDKRLTPEEGKEVIGLFKLGRKIGAAGKNTEAPRIDRS